MKRRGSSDSLGALISICPTEEKSSAVKNTTTTNNHVYSRGGFQSMLEGLEEDDCLEESSQISEKKRRLSVDQVKALEKNFEVENKLEPERKIKLAQELGLQPRQVAVWFQNRRARWKTKQLEKDYGFLKADYETLKRNFESLQRDKEALLAELKELKSKLQEENTESEISIKEEILISESENKVFEQSKISTTGPTTQDGPDNNNGAGLSVFGDFKDGSSDSDSSAIVNEDNTNNNSPNAAISSSGVLQQHQLLMSPTSSSLKLNCPSSSSPSSMNCFQFSDSRAVSASTQKAYQHQQFLRMEEHNFFGAEETCNFFSDDQAPTLQWYYCADQWN